MKPQEKIKFGARPINPLHRLLHRKFIRKPLPKSIRGIGFDWNVGFDIRDTIGPLPIKNQGNNDSCSGQAGSEFLQIQRLRQGIKEGEISAKSIYAPISYQGGGTTVTSLIQQICTKGANLESNVHSYDANGAPLSEAMMIEKSWVTPQTTADAFARAGYTPYDISEDIDEVATVISQWGAVIFEIAGQNGHTPGWTSPTPQPPSKNNPNPVWFHFMTGIGAKMIDGKKYIIAMQSEGPSWGDNGIQYISEDYFQSGFVIDAFTLIYNANLVPKADNHDLWAELLRWWKILKFQLKT